MVLFCVWIEFDVYGFGGNQRIVEQDVDCDVVCLTGIYRDRVPCASGSSSDLGLLKFDFDAVCFGGFTAQKQLRSGFDEDRIGFGDRFVEGGLESRFGPNGKFIVGKIFHEPVGAGQ